MIYIACFAISVLCAYLDTRDKKKKLIGIFGWLAILLPAVLAGLRDVSVGTDTAAYVNHFKEMTTQSFTQFISAKAYMEIGFRFLFFIISRFTSNPAWALFAAHLFMMFFVYKSLTENVDVKYTWLGLAIFYLLFFSLSMNTLRQYMASALILWGFKFVREKKLINWLAVVIFAALFHVTSVAAVFIYFLYQLYVIRTDSTGKDGMIRSIRPEKKLVISLCILAGAVLILVFSRQLILLLNEITGKFSVQVKNIYDYFAIDYYDIVSNLLILLPFLLFRRSQANANGDCDFYGMVIVLCMILYQLDMISYNAGRIVLPFWILFVFAVPTLVSKLNGRKLRAGVTAYYLLMFMWSYYSSYVLNGSAEIWPYTSEILKIG